MPVEALPAPQVGARADPDAGLVWVEFRDRLRGFVARRISNGADVDDIVGWVFLQLHRSLAGIRDGGRIHAWMYQTARRAIADYYRSPRRRIELPSGDTLDLEALASSRVEEPAPSDLLQMAECLAPMVKRLPAPYRQAIELTELEGRRVADAAGVASVSVSGMKSRVQRGRHRLRTMLLACCEGALNASSPSSGLVGCGSPARGAACCETECGGGPHA